MLNVALRTKVALWLSVEAAVWLFASHLFAPFDLRLPMNAMERPRRGRETHGRTTILIALAERREKMAGAPIVSTKTFQGIRVEVDTSISFDEVLSRLRRRMGEASARELVALAKEAVTEAEYAQKVQERFVGESGFVLFHEIDHGGWLPRFGVSRRVVRWILGNPLIAVTMIRHDIIAGLFAPVEILVTEKGSGAGATIAYVRPSSLMVIEENPPLLEAAKALDEKLDALIANATAA